MSMVGQIGELMLVSGVRPDTHPGAIELCAGDGPLADWLTRNGWEPKNVYCVDMYRSPDPLAESVNWLYLDLEQLVNALYTHGPIPENILSLKHQFHLVSMAFNDGKMLSNGEKYACSFFARTDAFIYRT